MDKWQRVSPIAILYFFFSSAINILSNSFYLLPIIIPNYQKILNNPHWIFFAVAAILITLLLLAFIQYFFFRYQLSEQHIEIRSGFLFKKHLNLPFERIQNVKLITPFYFRPFAYTSLELDSAGSVKNEAKLVAITKQKAQSLKQLILSIQKQETEKTQEKPEEIEQEKLLNQRSLSDLIIHGITNNRVWIFLATLTPFTESIINFVTDKLQAFGIDIKSWFSTELHPWWELSLYIISLAILAYITVMLLSIIGAVIAFYDYKLTKRHDNYVQRCGLLSKHEVVMKLSRIQLIIRQQDWLDLLLKRINLKFEQFSSIQSQKSSVGRNKVLVPSITDLECQRLITDVWPDNQLSKIGYYSISKQFIFKNIFFYLLPLHSLIATILIFSENMIALSFLALSFIGSSAFIFFRWQRWGFNRDQHFLYIRKGLFGVDYYCLPINKIQQVKFRQSLFMRKRKLGHIDFISAAGCLTIPFIDQSRAWQYLEQSLLQVEHTKQSWM